VVGQEQLQGHLPRGADLVGRGRDGHPVRGGDAAGRQQVRPALDLDAAVRGYRAGLDALPVDATTADDIVREAQRAFQLHIRLFDELAGASARGARQDARSAG
jgi:hypothetical protein